MTKIEEIRFKLATALTAFLGIILFICANTTSCGIIHQPKTPEQLSLYSKFNK